MKKAGKGIRYLVLAALVFALCFACMPQSAETDRPDGPSVSSVPDPAPAPLKRIPARWADNGIFSDGYEEAFRVLQSMTQEEKIGQVLLPCCTQAEALGWIDTYHPAGFVLFRVDFENKTPREVRETLRSYQQTSSVPLLLAVDEEGGTVVRVSGEPQLSDRRFASPADLYRAGGLDAIAAEEGQKAELLTGLGLTANLAPVCDLSGDPQDFIYDRTMGDDPALTSAFVRTAVRVSLAHGLETCLKHFPGYGGNVDTHTGLAVDTRPMDEFRERDFLPFSAGIRSGVPMVMVSHNIVTAMDADRPASLSPQVHRVLRTELGFTGVIVTDDLAMGAIEEYAGAQHPAAAALNAGNSLLIVQDLPGSFEALSSAMKNGTVSQEKLDHAAFLVLAMKAHSGLLQETA